MTCFIANVVLLKSIGLPGAVTDLENRHSMRLQGFFNLLDETPEENPAAAAGVGNRYSQWAPGGFNGQFLYARIVYDF